MDMSLLNPVAAYANEPETTAKAPLESSDPTHDPEAHAAHSRSMSPLVFRPRLAAGGRQTPDMVVSSPADPGPKLESSPQASLELPETSVWIDEPEEAPEVHSYRLATLPIRPKTATKAKKTQRHSRKVNSDENSRSSAEQKGGKRTSRPIPSTTGVRKNGKRVHGTRRTAEEDRLDACRQRFEIVMKGLEWTEWMKDDLARVYVEHASRCAATGELTHETWEVVGRKLGLPTRVVETMYWQMGEAEMAERVRSRD